MSHEKLILLLCTLTSEYYTSKTIVANLHSTINNFDINHLFFL